MKRNYMKPLASAVAFVVNENIASSFTDAEGTAYFSNGTGAKTCNKLINGTGIETGLTDGDFNIYTAFANIMKVVDELEGDEKAKVWELYEQLKKEGPDGFICA